MIFTILFSLSLLSAATSSPITTPTTANIDFTGPIPSDATPLPNGGFSFTADSSAAIWARAQSSLSPLTARSNSGLSMTLWTAFGCGGAGAYFPNLQYGVQSVGPVTYYQSIQLNNRGLYGNEQLDFSQLRVQGGDKCADYQKSAPNGLGAGCHDEGAFSCIRLLSW